MKPKFAHKVIIQGRRIDLTAKTDVAATFRRVRAEQAALAKQTAEVVKPIRRKA